MDFASLPHFSFSLHFPHQLCLSFLTSFFQLYFLFSFWLHFLSPILIILSHISFSLLFISLSHSTFFSSIFILLPLSILPSIFSFYSMTLLSQSTFCSILFVHFLNSIFPSLFLHFSYHFLTLLSLQTIHSYLLSYPFFHSTSLPFSSAFSLCLLSPLCHQLSLPFLNSFLPLYFLFPSWLRFPSPIPIILSHMSFFLHYFIPLSHSTFLSPLFIYFLVLLLSQFCHSSFSLLSHSTLWLYFLTLHSYSIFSIHFHSSLSFCGYMFILLSLLSLPNSFLSTFLPILSLYFSPFSPLISTSKF